mgnify:CR=1 FL=1
MRMKYKLICFDLDGVIFKEPNFWLELHKKFGTFEKGKKLTKEHLHNDYEKLVEEVVSKLWKGRDAGPYYELVDSVEYNKGVKEVFDFIKKNKIISAIVSSSSIDVVKRVKRDFQVDYIFANKLVIKDGKVSGEFVWPIGAGKENKARIIRELCKKIEIRREECVCIGDSDVDIEAFKEVGLSIAFNSDSDELKKVATCVVNNNNLSEILKYVK